MILAGSEHLMETEHAGVDSVPQEVHFSVEGFLCCDWHRLLQINSRPIKIKLNKRNQIQIITPASSTHQNNIQQISANPIYETDSMSLGSQAMIFLELWRQQTWCQILFHSKSCNYFDMEQMHKTCWFVKDQKLNKELAISGVCGQPYYKPMVQHEPKDKTSLKGIWKCQECFKNEHQA